MKRLGLTGSTRRGKMKLDFNYHAQRFYVFGDYFSKIAPIELRVDVAPWQVRFCKSLIERYDLSKLTLPKPKPLMPWYRELEKKQRRKGS